MSVIRVITGIIAFLLMANVFAENAPDVVVKEKRQTMIVVEDAIEAESLDVNMTDNTHGYINGRVCDQCKMIRIKVVPETQAKAKGQVVPLKSVILRKGQPALVVFTIKDKTATRIEW